MKIIKEPLTIQEIDQLKTDYGDYFKLTIDLNNEILVAGVKLHADGKPLLIKKGGKTEDIWGGGINLSTKVIDTMAVLNLRSRLGNESMELLDPVKREKFIKIAKKIFVALWD